MSLGLGKAEKMIIKALKRNGDSRIDDLCLFRIHGLNFFDIEIQEEIGSFYMPNRSSAIYQSTARAVRNLNRKGLVKCRKCPDQNFKREFNLVGIA